MRVVDRLISLKLIAERNEELDRRASDTPDFNSAIFAKLLNVRRVTDWHASIGNVCSFGRLPFGWKRQNRTAFGNGSNSDRIKRSWLNKTAITCIADF